MGHYDAQYEEEDRKSAAREVARLQIECSLSPTQKHCFHGRFSAGHAETCCFCGWWRLAGKVMQPPDHGPYRI